MAQHVVIDRQNGDAAQYEKQHDASERGDRNELGPARGDSRKPTRNGQRNEDGYAGCDDGVAQVGKAFGAQEQTLHDEADRRDGERRHWQRQRPRSGRGDDGQRDVAAP